VHKLVCELQALRHRKLRRVDAGGKVGIVQFMSERGFIVTVLYELMTLLSYAVFELSDDSFGAISWSVVIEVPVSAVTMLNKLTGKLGE
jgi:hypothetical protein